MQQPSTNPTTIVSQTSLEAVLAEIRSGVSDPGFFDHRYEDDDDLEPEPQAEVEVAQ
jgi:hypothetical protein